ncbi:uncharacterized protein BO96DRAFT_410629 [Aspergillus niger CBS 101883]|uniref:Uncharacterized protein n=1 Tax=Aspergillus niger ATCC 13496 TaxID=1353008 RepID=A0A370CDI5_ASPNG|nr:uncharacterized protein BO96DRAFT_410629 [Aspergillus niger CBS 101883]PYH58607.1 hypothetical protein BO96DRAFT_410629 [Aspergillus niger CBS 101883]RDH25828.1 hypothetical protein M747DRAFT_291591 [Aspergillus niger ATCC 13496]
MFIFATLQFATPLVPSPVQLCNDPPSLIFSGLRSTTASETVLELLYACCDHRQMLSTSVASRSALSQNLRRLVKWPR